MKDLKKILVPVDFSSASANALHYAILLADRINAAIDVLHVTPLEGTELEYGVYIAEITQQKVEAAKEQLKTFVNTSIIATEQMLKEAPILSYDSEMGAPVIAICEIAKKKAHDLIVIGSRGANRSTLQKLMGSVAKGVVKSSKCPVLVIPEESTFSGINTMTYASEIQDADPFEIWKTLKLLAPFNPKLRLIHITKNVSEDIDEKLSKFSSFFKENVPSLEIETRQVYGKDVEQSINNYIEVNPSDILAMYQSSHGFWDSILFRSTTSAMAMISKIPLLILKQN